ncbi:MAG: hypothetical protein EOS50_29855 [Mesorhizobium sp.]|nr:MAG: hypothetical protein EOS50_29855 [Mesorhizobium sp.]
MRKLVVTEFISVDGIAGVEKLPGVMWNDEKQRFKEDELADSGAMLLGRTTHEIFAERFNALPKYVASTSLKALDWLANLEKIAAAKPEIVVPGHMTAQAATDLSGVEHTKTYLIAFEEELAKSKDAASLKAAMEARFTLGGRKRAAG